MKTVEVGNHEVMVHMDGKMVRLVAIEKGT